MPGLHHREPGPVAAAAADPRVTLEVIADGVHLHPDIVRIAFDAAPRPHRAHHRRHGRSRARRRAVRPRRLEVEVVDGVARLSRDGSIAGSTLTQDAALRCAVAAGVELADAVRGADLDAGARRSAAARDLGALAPGFTADAVLLTADLAVRRVWTAGDGERA